MRAGDALFEDGRVPRKLNIDDGVGGLQVEAGGAGIGGDEEFAFGVLLKLTDQALATVLRYRAVESYEREATFFQQGFDDIQHVRPFGKEDDFAVFLGGQLFEEDVELFEFARIPGGLLVDQIGAVGRHAADEQGFLQTQEVHFGEEAFPENGADGLLLRGMNRELFFSGSNPTDFGGAGRKVLHHLFSGPAQQDGLQPAAHFIEMPVSEHFALFIFHPMAVEKPEGGSETTVIHKFHHRIELVQAIFQRGP